MNGWWRASVRARVRSNLYDQVYLMTIDSRVSGWITKATQFSGRGARYGTDFDMSGRNNSTK